MSIEFPIFEIVFFILISSIWYFFKPARLLFIVSFLYMFLFFSLNLVSIVAFIDSIFILDGLCHCRLSYLFTLCCSFSLKIYLGWFFEDWNSPLSLLGTEGILNEIPLNWIHNLGVLWFHSFLLLFIYVFWPPKQYRFGSCESANLQL